jgi:thiol:disulfide interchange protein DsbD
MKQLFTWILLLVTALIAPVTHAEDEFLDPDAAFSVSVTMKNASTVTASFKVADGYYLYQDRISFAVPSGNIQLGKPQMPTATLKNDPNFGDVSIYKHDFSVDIPLTGQGEFELLTKYQGCASAGLCYPPQKKTTVLSTQATTANNNNSVSDFISQAKQQNSAVAVTTPPKQSFDTNEQQGLSETDKIAGMLSGGNVALTLLFFFGVGLLLAFTPCVFPMIPILSSIIVGQGANLTTRRAFTLSLVYVLAMALTYTAAGVLAGIFGANLQAAFQNPWILAAFSGIFIVLSLSMFGFFELQLPASIQAKLADVSNKQQGGTLAGVAVMGLLSALIVGPCVAPPLAGALIYIGQTGDAVLGGAALFALSMGMGLPLLAVGTAAGKYMPRAGGWMDNVKAVFGVALLAVAIWMLARILPDAITLLLWAMLAIASAIYLGALDIAQTGWQKLWKSVGIALLAWGIFLLIAVASGGKSSLEPLSHLAQANGSSDTVTTHANFKQINSSAELDKALADAKSQGKVVMLDFYADWCVSCKEMAQFTFGNTAVSTQMSQMMLLQVNMTNNTAEQQALLKRFGLVGPPAILFFDPQAQEKRGLRVIGFMKAEAFAQQLTKALAP